VDDPRQVDDPERSSSGQQQPGGEGAQLRDDEQRLAPDPVAPPPEEGTTQELAEGVGPDQEPHRGRARPELLRGEGKQREDDRQPEDVGEDDEEDGNERRALHGPSPHTRSRPPRQPSVSAAGALRTSASGSGRR